MRYHVSIARSCGYDDESVCPLMRSGDMTESRRDLLRQARMAPYVSLLWLPVPPEQTRHGAVRRRTGALRPDRSRAAAKDSRPATTPRCYSLAGPEPGTRRPV